MDSGGVLVLADGGLPGLVACAAAWGEQGGSPRRPIPLVWCPPTGTLSQNQRRLAASRQAQFYSLSFVAVPGEEAIPHAPTPGQRLTHTLVAAAYFAAGHACARVVWPVCPGGSGAAADELDPARLADATDRALLVTRLAGMDGPEHGCPSIRVDTPHADLTDTQLAELAIDLDVPVHLCWWWGAEGRALDTPMTPTDDAAGEARRWLGALRRAGWTPDPDSAPRARPAPGGTA